MQTKLQLERQIFDAKGEVTHAGISFSGFGQAYGSFGEIVQGRLSTGDDFLVTLPINMWSRSCITLTPKYGRSVVHCALNKSKKVAEILLPHLGLEEGYHIAVAVDQGLPVGKGLSSSTADMLAVIRAFQDALDAVFSNGLISDLFSQIEPHDGLHYDTCVIYNHRRGRLLKGLQYIPQYTILALDLGGGVDTMLYNEELVFNSDEMAEYDKLYERLVSAFRERDNLEIANCAHRSTELHAERTNNAILFDLLRVANNVKSLGVINTHSGSCVGMLFPPQINVKEIEDLRTVVSDRFNIQTFVARSLHYLDTGHQD